MPLSGLIIMWNRLNAPRVRVGKEAVAAQADIDGEQLLPHTPNRNLEEACNRHVTDHLRDVILRASGRCTLTWRLGVCNSVAVEVFTECVPVRGSYGQLSWRFSDQGPGL
jgi:hypothetical protein